MLYNISTKPLVSIIIPTYNRAEYLIIAINSVLAQTYRNFELLILDNNSSDHTQNIISSYSDTRIKTIKHLVNIGGIPNWLYGMSWAKGEFFTILGDDDYYKPDFIQARVNAFIKFPDVMVVFSDHDTCDENGLVTLSPRKLISQNAVELSGNDLLRTLDNSYRSWQIGSGLYKRDPIVRWWAECIHAGKAFDTALQVLIACCASAVFIPDKGLVYRSHTEQDSRIGGVKLIIGIVNAYLEPLIYSNNKMYSKELKKGALWALHLLGISAYHRGDKDQARQIVRFSLYVCLWNIKTWYIIFLIYMPNFVIKFIKLIKKQFMRTWSQ